jgi:hypothetical protein
MKEIDEKSTEVLLAVLDNEINVKCIELREKHREAKLKNIFFISCLFIIFFFILQALLKIFNVNLILAFIVYQGLALVFTAPLFINIKGKELSK